MVRVRCASGMQYIVFNFAQSGASLPGKTWGLYSYLLTQMTLFAISLLVLLRAGFIGISVSQ